jgi:cystathionine beta-lyase
MESKIMYDFTTSSDRTYTNAEKYTLREQLFKKADINPVWVADMDINSPPFVIEDLKNRLNHPILGYEELPEYTFRAQRDWIQILHRKSYKIDDMIFSPSVVASINIAIQSFTTQKDSIIVQTPVYPPFFKSVINNKRELLLNPLKQNEDNKYLFDIDDFKAKIKPNTKLLILCNPHNPVGRAWNNEELQEIVDICKKNNIIIFSDEVHCDLVYAPYKHTPTSVIKGAKDITISAYGIGKTFNLSGMNISTVIIENEDLKKQFITTLHNIHFAAGNSLGHIAMQSAYVNGFTWVKELKEHLYNNYLDLENLLKEYEHLIKLVPTEATYLAWFDCKGMGLGDSELNEFFIQKANLGLNRGLSFGRVGRGFMRLNFAVSKEQMKVILEQLENALKEFKK